MYTSTTTLLEDTILPTICLKRRKVPNVKTTKLPTRELKQKWIFRFVIERGTKEESVTNTYPVLIPSNVSPFLRCGSLWECKPLLGNNHDILELLSNGFYFDRKNAINCHKCPISYEVQRNIVEIKLSHHPSCEYSRSPPRIPRVKKLETGTDNEDRLLLEQTRFEAGAKAETADPQKNNELQDKNMDSDYEYVKFSQSETDAAKSSDELFKQIFKHNCSRKKNKLSSKYKGFYSFKRCQWITPDDQRRDLSKGFYYEGQTNSVRCLFCPFGLTEKQFKDKYSAVKDDSHRRLLYTGKDLLFSTEQVQDDSFNYAGNDGIKILKEKIPLNKEEECSESKDKQSDTKRGPSEVVQKRQTENYYLLPQPLKDINLGDTKIHRDGGTCVRCRNEKANIGCANCERSVVCVLCLQCIDYCPRCNKKLKMTEKRHKEATMQKHYENEEAGENFNTIQRDHSTCGRCRKSEAIIRCLQCRQSVICESCLDCIDFCPECDQRFICCRCSSNGPNIVFENCWHLTCLKCSESVDLCPQCDGKIRKRRRVVFAAS